MAVVPAVGWGRREASTARFSPLIRLELTSGLARGREPAFCLFTFGSEISSPESGKVLTNVAPGRKLGAALRFPQGQRAKVPPPDYWIPVPATGSRSPALRRRWTPIASAPLDQPHGYWSAAPSNGAAAPILERHWTPETPWILRKTNHNAQTVTAGRESAMLPAQAEATRLAESITPIYIPVSIPPLLSQTVTRLCVGCGQPLEGKRPQAKAHGAACRQRAYRRQKKAAAQAQDQREAGHQAEPQQAGLVHTTIG
jgi:hypothetical protein